MKPLIIALALLTGSASCFAAGEKTQWSCGFLWGKASRATSFQFQAKETPKAVKPQVAEARFFSYPGAALGNRTKKTSVERRVPAGFTVATVGCAWR